MSKVLKYRIIYLQLLSGSNSSSSSSNSGSISCSSGSIYNNVFVLLMFFS